MKEIFRINGPGIRFLDAKILDALEKIYPNGVLGAGWRCVLEAHDERIPKILDLFRSFGYPASRSGEKEGPRGSLVVLIRREYSKEDLDSFELLEFDLSGERYVDDSQSRDTQGRIMVDGRALKQTALHNILFVNDQSILVSDHARGIFEKEKIRGLNIREAVLVDENEKPIGWTRFGQTYWELDSSVELPPFSPSVELHDKNEQPVKPDFSSGCVPKKSGFNDFRELRYCRADIEKIGGFDIARSHERIALYNYALPPHFRIIIMSQRFRQICITHKIEAEWWPVWIEES